MTEIQENLGDHSDDENEMNLLNSNKKTRPRFKILDSDSDSEIKEPSESAKLTPEPVSEEETISNLNNENNRKKRKRVTMMSQDSDSEVEEAPERTLTLKNISDRPKDKKTINSDSEASEEEITPHNKSFPNEETAVEAIIYTTNYKGDLIVENTSTNPIQKSSLAALCDSESSEEEREQNVTEASDEEIIKPKVYKPKKRNNNDKPKRMTGQEAAKQRSEIQSESQRMLRESNVSLPYHIPKSYTIKEFLQKRSKLAFALPLVNKASPSVAIKMTKDQLEEVSKKLDERIKEVEEFYKSESEEEEEDNDQDVAKAMRDWLELVVDKAVDTVENKNKSTNEEPSEAINNQEESPDRAQSMDYEFNLDVNESETLKIPTVSELLQEKLRNIQPRLSGGPDDIIDLEKGITKPSAVKKLVDKFFQHAMIKHQQKHTVELNVVGVGGGGEIVTETVMMNVEEEEKPVMVETPGAKLQKLREELQNQMAQRRSELWKQKQEQGECLAAEKKIENDDTVEKDILDDEEEEFEMTESETEDIDDEDDYSIQLEKPKIKSAFVEDEAAEDDIEDEDDIESDADIEGDDDNDGDDEEPEIDTSEKPKKKILKRILKPFSEDSDEEDEFTQESIIPQTVKDSLDSTASAEEDFVIPPNLPRLNVTPQRPQLERNKSELDFLTPVSFLTGLQNLNSESKTKDSPIISPLRMAEPSPLKETDWQSRLQKKLFTDQTDFTQESCGDLAEICSGEFPETQNCVSEELPTSTQDLLNVCSGEFSSLPENNSTQNREPSPNETVIHIETNPDKEIKSLDEDHDQLITQLLDEEELERFKKKFESPVTSTINKSHNFEDAEEVKATGLIDSDDENEGLEITKRRRQKKLVFSDDEESSDDGGELEQEDEEQIDLHDTDDEEQLLENEVKAQQTLKASDFFEKEAELSESDWDSADEDEKDLDVLEFEKGDEETFDENKVRSDLERIQMRQMLDDDNREVKLLQELLLEDGELHGSGRQRQFRWKFLDSGDNGEYEKRDDDDIYLDEEESEEQFRKMRYKREMFLKKKSTVEDVENILSDSQILKTGQQVLKKSQSYTSQNNNPENKSESTVKEPFSLLSKRGSFLSRNDQVLQRLAEYTKIATNPVGSTAKNSRCFVFQTVEAAEANVKDNNNKRKAADGTPNVIKKLRLSDLSPAVTKQKTGKPGGAKKLFGNW